MPQRPVPELVVYRLKWWWWFSMIWRVIHYCLGLTATVSSVLVAAHASLPDAWSHWSLSTFSLITAVSTGILTFLNASAKSRAYMHAWRLVNNESSSFQLNPNYPEAALATALRKGEAIIAKSDT